MTPAPTDILDVDVALVTGPMRTGTTLVARILDSHPRAAYLGFELAEQWADWTGLPFGAPGADDVACPPLDAADATPGRVERARAGLNRLLRRHLADTGARPDLVVLKSPHLWHRLGFVFEVLPQARVVRTRRGLMATVASLERLWERALAQHGRVHHLPSDVSRCWDFVPAAGAGGYDRDRTFPGGRVEVLAEFVDRVENALDQLERRRPGRCATVVSQRHLLFEFDETIRQLQTSLNLPLLALEPPEPLDPARLDEWRELLAPAQRRALERFVA